MLQLIVNSNDHHITPCRIQGWPRRGSIDEEADFLAGASPVTCAIGDFERIIHAVPCCRPFL
jgi:hypothetical protein